MSKFIDFVEIENPGKKTRKFLLKNKKGIVLGSIEYFNSWRKYVFIPEYDTLFDSICLNDISSFMEELK